MYRLGNTETVCNRSTFKNDNCKAVCLNLEYTAGVSMEYWIYRNRLGCQFADSYLTVSRFQPAAMKL